MHGSLPEPKLHVSKLASVLIIVDLEGQAAKKRKKIRLKVQFVMAGKGILGPKRQNRKNKNDSVPSGSFSSESVGRKLSK